MTQHMGVSPATTPSGDAAALGMLDFIGDLYLNTEDDVGWAGVFARLSHRLATVTSHYFVIDTAGAVVGVAYDGYDPSANAAYYQRFLVNDPRMLISKAYVGRVFSDVDVIDGAAFERSDVYNEALVPFGIRYTLFSTFPIADDVIGAQAFMRSRRTGAFDRNDVDALQLLLPHIQQATRLRHLLGHLRRSIGDLEAALSSSPSPLLILDGTGRIHAASRRGMAIIDGNDGLRVRQGRLEAERGDETASLRTALASVVRLVEPTRRSGAPSPEPRLVTIARREGPPLSLLLLPLHEGHSLAAKSPRAGRVLAIVHDPTATVALDPSVVVAATDLTMTEALLAVFIAQGGTLASFAAERGTSEHTARTQLKRILDKTGTTRQADLVRFLLTSSALHSR